MRMNSYFASGSSISSGSGTSAQLRQIGAIGDDQVLAVDEAVRTRRIGRAGERHCKRTFADLMDPHTGVLPTLGVDLPPDRRIGDGPVAEHAPAAHHLRHRL